MPSLQEYVRQGATMLHLVDLSGARDPKTQQVALLTRLLTALSPALVQIGGGIRNTADIETLLNASANRVVVGSSAVKYPQTVQKMAEIFWPRCTGIST